MSGAALVAVALRDIFHQLFRPSGAGGVSGATIAVPEAGLGASGGGGGPRRTPRAPRRKAAPWRAGARPPAHYDFDDVVGLAFDQVRRAAFTSGQVAVLERLLEVLERAISANPVPERQRPLWARAFAVARLAPGQVADPEDAANLVRKAVGVGAPLLGTDLRAEVAFDLKEVANLADGLRGGGRVREAVDAALGEPS